MSFPTSPTNGQLAVVNNITYQFDSTKQAWVRVLQAADFLTVNNLSVLKSLSGNISGGNVYATGYFYANGQPFVSSGYSDVNVAAYLAGNVTAGNVSATGYFWANGTPFLSSGYGNVNVAAYLTTATINTTGNITGGGVRNTAGPTPPANPFPGDTWYDTDNDVMLRYVYDGDSLQWVDISGLMVGSAGGGYKFTTSPTPPAVATVGDNWYDTSTDILFRYITDGVTYCWVDNSSIGIEYQTYGNANVSAYLLGNTTHGNILAQAYYFANGAPFTSSNYGNTSVAAYLPSDSTIISLNSNITTANTGMKSYVDARTYSNVDTAGYLAGNVTTGNISAQAYYFANGTPFTSSNYGNTQVAAYLLTNTGNIAAGNVSATGYYFANGTPFTSSNYGNTQVAAYLLTNTGNISAGNISASNVTTTANVTAGNLLVTQIYWAANNTPYAGFLLNTRTTANVTTSSIANNTVANVNVTGYKGYNLYKIYSSHAAWVRVYTSLAALTSDASRAQGTDPTPDVGVITEVITSTPTTTIQLSPAVLGYNNETVPNVSIPVAVTNLSGGANAITVSLTMVQTEL